jgi:ketosteroid isomerase-like protein
MPDLSTDDIQHAYSAAVAGDLDPLVALLSPDLEWRGLDLGHWL